MSIPRTRASLEGRKALVVGIANDKSIGMSGQEQPQDAKPRFSSHCRKHVGVTSDLLTICFLPGHTPS